MNAKAIVLGTSMIMLAGCASVGPDYIAPTHKVSASGQAASAEFRSSMPVASWWSQFGDPVLDQLVREALQASPDIRVALSRVNEARAAFSEQRLELAPQVTAGLEGTRNSQSVEGRGRTRTEEYSAGFDATWELDLFGRIRRETEAAHADLVAQRNDLEAVQVTVAAEVARSYFELRGIQKRLAVARQTLETLGQTQRLTESLFEAGSGSQLEVQSSLARVKAVEAELPSLEALEGQTAHRLAVLVGRHPGELASLLVPRETKAFAKALPIGDTSQVLRQRPDVRAAERRLAAATARVGVATADLFPRVSLRGFIGFLSGGWGNLIDSDNRAWQVTPSISWSALDMGSVRARLRATEARADGVAAEYEKTVLAALEDTENALLLYAKQQSRLRLQHDQVLAARRAAELAELRYRAGSIDFLTLLDAQRTELAASDALAQTESAVNVAVVRIYKALGGWGEQDAVELATSK